MVFTIENNCVNKHSFETAINLTGFGKYNIHMLVACSLVIIAMYTDIFGFSVIMPAVACDLSLDTAEQGLLSAVPLIGVMISSYGWGLAADTIGRRKALLIAMPIGFVLNMAASMAPGYKSLAALKFFSATFTSAANAAAFVLMAESVPEKNRSRFIIIMATVTMFMQCFISCFAAPVFQLTFHWKIPLLSMEYRPWRLLMQIISLPGAIGVLHLLFLKESPKFLLSKSKNKEALLIMQNIFQWNSGQSKDTYLVKHVYLDENNIVAITETSLLKKIWNQTAPLFKPPLLKNSAILYYLLLSAYMTSTGFTMWVPTMSNAFFLGEDNSGRSFCEVTSRSASVHKINSTDCDHTMEPFTLYAVMCYSIGATICSVGLSFIVAPLGKKFTTIMVFALTVICGVLLLFSRSPYLSIALFYLFLYVSIVLGNVNTYLVELNPTHLRGMATCLSVVVARGFGFLSVQLIANLLANYCTLMISGYVVLVISGLVIATFLPPNIKASAPSNPIEADNRTN